jgi:hypothetical protein
MPILMQKNEARLHARYAKHSFIIEGGRMNINDPACNQDNIFAMWDTNCLVGRYNVLLLPPVGETKQLYAWHEEYDWNSGNIEHCKQILSLGSGRIILCDSSYFPSDNKSHTQLINQLMKRSEPIICSTNCFVCEVTTSNEYCDAYIVRDDQSRLQWLCVDFESEDLSSS